MYLPPHSKEYREEWRSTGPRFQWLAQILGCGKINLNFSRNIKDTHNMSQEKNASEKLWTSLQQQN